MAKKLTTKEKNEQLAIENKQLKHYGLVLRIYPNDEQQDLLNRTFGCVRLVFNQYLDARKTYYRDHRKTLSVSKYKKEVLNPSKNSDQYAFLKDVDKFALEVACENVEDAFKRFFKRQNKYPKFKNKRKAKKAYTTKFTNNNIAIPSISTIKLPKLGQVKVVGIKSTRNRSLIHKIMMDDIRILKATISQKGFKYYVSLCLEEVVELVQPLKLAEIELSKAVGIDLGLKTFAAIYNGEDCKFIEKMNYIKESEKKLTKLQRRLSKKTVDSQNYKKASHKVAKLQEHIANQRKDFAHKQSSQIADENQVVILETLNIKGMVKNRKLSKVISDAGWSQFISFLRYKLQWRGKYFVQIDRWFASSKLCSECGDKNTALTLNDREWICGTCRTIHERDENAAKNIRKEGLRTLMV